MESSTEVLWVLLHSLVSQQWLSSAQVDQGISILSEALEMFIRTHITCPVRVVHRTTLLHIWNSPTLLF